MATFSKHQIIPVSPSMIPEMAEAIRREFEHDGYEISIENLYSGGSDVSITKGGVFKAVLGLKTALKISLQPRENSVLFDANVGIFGQQFIPTVISMLFFWPVLITQIWGLVEQASLDDRALKAAESVIGMAAPAPQAGGTFCPTCGKQIPEGAKFCPTCGQQL